MPKLAKIAVTCGDPSGVGPEIIASWLRENPQWADSICPIGPSKWLESLDVNGLSIGETAHIIQPGKADKEGAHLAWEAMEIAARGCTKGIFRAVVTGPISKFNMRQVGFGFPGQTEFFAERWGGDPTMGFAGERLRVVLTTWHVPLYEVPELLKNDPTLLDKAVRRAFLLARLEGLKEPRIAVCGLNPHAGEQGEIGSEELEFIDPQLKELQKEFPLLSLTLPADTVFHRVLEGDFDVVVALYHDQGLIPLKTLEFHAGVNITLGLPHIRTSPDHGTGFDIAGKGIARNESFNRAVILADRYSRP